MSDNPSTGRTFTEGEAYALVDDAVKRETAQAQDKITTLQSENTSLQTKVDVLETEKAQLVQRAQTAEQELTDFKASVETEKAQEARKAERLRQVAEANALLDISDESEAGKGRQTRIAAMSDDEFTAYLADMREVASKSEPKGKDAKPAEDGAKPPRETAAFSGEPGAKTKTGSVVGLFNARRQVQGA